MSKLVDKISSDYFEARNALNKSRDEEIAIYVESEEDIPFWKDIFDNQGVKTRIFPASKNTLNRGKQEVLKLKNNVGKYLLLCVDSDLDYLLQDKTDTSKLINENPYIFQTYTYSIENYKCFAESLHSVVVKATLQDEPELFNYVDFLERYSDVIFELFVYFFYFQVKNSEVISPTTFSETIKIFEQIDIFNTSKTLNELRRRIKNKLSEIESVPKEEFENYVGYLNRLGATKQNIYLFIEGHTLYNNVVLMFLKPIAKYLRNKHYNSIKQQQKDPEEAENRRNQYKKSTTNIEVALQLNTDYYNCFLMQKIITDINKYQNLN